MSLKHKLIIRFQNSQVEKYYSQAEFEVEDRELYHKLVEIAENENPNAHKPQ